ncbi:MAG: UbiX family flavin prenyltransferase [Gammaproteobacteria bacterium]
MTNKMRLIVGMSGASGIIYGVRLLEFLKQLNVETHLVVSNSAKITQGYEMTLGNKALQNLSDFTYSSTDISAPISSGSFKTSGMIIAPCSMRSLSEIATGVTSSLLTRAADVVLKERRRLVLVVRESPLHAGHLKSMLAVTEMGGIIAPPVPAFYNNPTTLDDIINHTVGRILDLFNLDTGHVKRWKE